MRRIKNLFQKQVSKAFNSEHTPIALIVTFLLTWFKYKLLKKQYAHGSQ